MSPRTRLRDTRHWVGLTDYLTGNQEGPSYKITSKEVMGDQEEYSREKWQWKRIIFDGKDLMKRTYHYKNMLSLGIGTDLAWEEVEGTLKVVIVSFLYFIPWVSGLCNHFNIVSGVQLDKEGTSWLLPPSTLPLESWMQIYWE